MMMEASQVGEHIVDSTKLHSGLSDPREIKHAIAGTLRALAARLSPEIGERVRLCLPDELAKEFHSVKAGETFGPDELFSRVATYERVNLGFAREHAEAVCAAIAEALPPTEIEAIRRDLGRDLAWLFARPHENEGAPLPHLGRPAHLGSSLSTGRPGGTHPIAEAREPLAHHESVVTARDPHAKTKLSSSPGTTQERKGRTLAEGKPEPLHPLDAGDARRDDEV